LEAIIAETTGDSMFINVSTTPPTLSFFLEHREALARQMHPTNPGRRSITGSIAISDKSFNRVAIRR